jgi:hypothetical protein
MAEIFPIETFGITEDGGGFFKETPCFFRFDSAFPASQENTFLYIR